MKVCVVTHEFMDRLKALGFSTEGFTTNKELLMNEKITYYGTKIVKAGEESKDEYAGE